MPFVILFVALGSSVGSQIPRTNSAFTTCLPGDIKPTDVVSAARARATGNVVNKVTVQEKLAALKASCEKGQIVDGTGRPITFYKLTGCWGNPPMDYQDILTRQRAELEKLRNHYTVIEMTCNPSGLPIP